MSPRQTVYQRLENPPVGKILSNNPQETQRLPGKPRIYYLFYLHNEQ